ncbi:MAG: hypothetical protein AAF234_20360, partial [Pseudomonadota bacterium]
PLRLAAFSALYQLFSDRHAAAVAEGWHALAEYPALIEDLMHLGHMGEDPLTNPETGTVYTHEELIARAARQALVQQLLARAEITQDELNYIRKTGDTGYEIPTFDDGDGAGDLSGSG